MNALPIYALGVYLVVGIFYIFPSGMPQPADALLAGTILYCIVVWRRVPPADWLYIAIAIFCLWTMLVNAVWFGFAISDARFLKSTVFYIFNAWVLVFVVVAGYRDWTILSSTVRLACIAALFIQFVYLMLVPSAVEVGGVRPVGTFRNPNQLGYWAILAMSCLAVAKDRQPLTAVDVAALGAGAYALVMSLSKAAAISGFLTIVLVLAFGRVRLIPALLLAAAIAIGAGYHLSSETGVRVDVAERLEERLRGIGGQRDDNIMERGYSRIIKYPEYLIFGAGEGGYIRFPTLGPPHDEFHSTIGNIFFSYGIVGLALFVLLLIAVFARAPLAHMVYFLPIMMYGVTHMGLRVSEFWIFLAIVYAQSRWGNVARIVRAHSQTPLPCERELAELQRRISGSGWRVKGYAHSGSTYSSMRSRRRFRKSSSSISFSGGGGGGGGGCGMPSLVR